MEKYVLWFVEAIFIYDGVWFLEFLINFSYIEQVFKFLNHSFSYFLNLHHLSSLHMFHALPTNSSFYTNFLKNAHFLRRKNLTRNPTSLLKAESAMISTEMKLCFSWILWCIKQRVSEGKELTREWDHI